MISLPEAPQRPLSLRTTSSKGILRLQVAAARVGLLDGQLAPASIAMPSASSWLLPPVATETVDMIGPMKPILTVLTSVRLGDGAAGAGVLHLRRGSAPCRA